MQHQGFLPDFCLSSPPIYPSQAPEDLELSLDLPDSLLNLAFRGPVDLDTFDPATAVAKDIAEHFRAEIKLPGADAQVLPALPALPVSLPPPPALPQPKNPPQRLGSKRRATEAPRGAEPKAAKTGTYRIKIKDLGWFKLPHGYIPVRNTDLI
jgi:hypothetical protein